MKLSKYVIATDSIDNKYKLLYNKKNGYFIRYDKNLFENLDDFTNHKEIEMFLQNKDFFKSDEEFMQIKKEKNNLLESKGLLNLIVKVTKDCNLRCSYCYETSEKKYMDKYQADKLTKFIKKYVKQHSIHTVVLSWFGGEPTLNIDIINYILGNIKDFLKDNNVTLISSIVTNGYNLDKFTFNKLLELGISQFQITVDGSKEMHDKNRFTKEGTGSFDIILKNLINILNNDNNFSVTLRLNVNNTFFENLDSIKKDVLDYFKNDSRFIIDIHKIVDFDNFKNNNIDSILAETLLNLVTDGYKVIDQRINLNYNSSMCYAQRENHFVVDVDSKISKCTVCNYPFSYIGEINTEGILEFNDNLEIWKAVNKIECPDCNNYPICFGASCPLKSIIKNTNICKTFMNNDETLLKILNEQKKYNMTIGGEYV